MSQGLGKKKIELTHVGGRCPRCGHEDDWQIVHRDKVHGLEYEYFYELECQGEIRHDPVDEFGIGEIEACKYKRDITVCEEPEYNPEDAPDFFD